MKKFLAAIIIILFTIPSYTTPSTHNLPFNKVIIWGHKLHSHTHSYIHWGFYRAFKHLGYETHWLDNHDSLAEIDLSNSLFLTEGQVDARIPVRDDCLYMIHNCTQEKYVKALAEGRCMIFQVYTHDCLKRNEIKLDNCIFCDQQHTTLYIPWATDLLPYEIDAIKQQVPHIHKENAIYFVGTVWSGFFGNDNKLHRFADACQENNIALETAGGRKKKVSMEENIELIQKSYMAPALQGEWQCENGYIPCRIFKNISYGQFGITNSKAVYDLFEGKIVYNADPYQLFYDAKEKIDNLDINELYELMDVVRDKHTYLNRIETLLTFFGEIYNKEQNTNE